MKMTLATALVLFATHAFAAEPASFSSSDKDIKPISATEMAWRLHIDGDIFFVSNDGEKLISVADEHREWEYRDDGKPLVSNWFYEAKNLKPIALHQKWEIEKSGKITVQIQQYESFERAPGDEGDVKFGKLLREQSFVVKDFAPILWDVKDGDRKVVVRLTPGLWTNERSFDAGALPFSGKRMTIFDGDGQVWADQIDVETPAPYFGIVTHKGMIALSYVQFKGSTLLGTAKNGRIRLKDGKTKITIMSEVPFTPNQAKVNVYGVIDRSRKSEGLNSFRSYNSTEEDKFMKRVFGK